MEISDRGLELIQEFEGCRLEAYRDAAGVWTIGYGHTRGVKSGDVITMERAGALLREDIAIAEADVARLVTAPLSQPQFDALVSLVYNVGAKRLASSTLLRRLNGGDIAAAAEEIIRWVHAGGVRLAGLVRRREAERALFLS